MLLLLSFLGLIFCFLSNNVQVAALNITVQSNTIVGQPSLVLWAREPSDGDGLLVFDLRFVKPDNEDVGLAVANVQAPPSTNFGTVQVVFQSPSSYMLVAVSGPNLSKIGQSSQVNAFQVPTTSSTTSSILTTTSQPVVLSATSSATLQSTTTTVAPSRRKKNIGAIIGGTLGGVAFIGLATVGIVLLRRRQPTEDKPETRRWTFHRDKMVLPPILDIRRISTATRRMPPRRRPLTIRMPSRGRRMSESSMYSQFTSREDIEQQRLPQDDILSTFPIVMMRSPTRPRMAYPRPRPLPERPEPIRRLPPAPDQAQVAVEQMEQRRKNQMTQLGNNNPGPMQRIISDDSQKKINWL